MSVNQIEDVKVYLSTSGCVEAQLSSKCVERYLKKHNFIITRDVGQADHVIFYACGLTKESEKKSLQAINDLKTRMGKNAKLIVWGCLTKQNPQASSKLCNNNVVGPLGIQFKENLEVTDIPLEGIPVASSQEDLFSIREKSPPQSNKNYLGLFTNTIFLLKEVFHKLDDKLQNKTSSYYIRVAIGCTGNCTFCSERPVFGRVKSRPIDDVINDFKQGLQLGYNRFSLLATDLGAYGMDFNSNLGHLLTKMIEVHTDVNYTFILNQIEPNNLNKIYPDLEQILSSGKVEELMCPVQSGSNRILKLMGRNYRIEDWKSNMLKIHTKFPKIRLNTHLMVGFPTETDEDFEETKKLLDPPLFFDNITVFKYSSRPVTPSQRIPDQVPDEIKESRCEELLKRYAHICAFNLRH